MIVIGLTGMPAAGKSTTAGILFCWGVKRYNISDIITRELQIKNLPLTGEYYEKIASKLRKGHGDAYFAEEICKQIKMDRNTAEIICVDGIRTHTELEIFKREFDTFILVALWAPYNIRLQRALRPVPHVVNILSPEDFAARDKRNIELGVGTSVALADILILNDIDGFDTLEERMKTTLRDLSTTPKKS